MKDFLSIETYPKEILRELLRIAARLKRLYGAGVNDLCLVGKTIVMLFEKPSLRTRASFEVAMVNLGGGAIYVKPHDIGGIGKREPVKDIARVLSRYTDAIVARTFSHRTIEELAENSDIPVINALSDRFHPCQVMGDMLTIKENTDVTEGTNVAFIGDGNNVARSLAIACARFGMKFVIASPKGYDLDTQSIDKANEIAAGSARRLHDPVEAVSEADFIYTDTWVSMGQEDEKDTRLEDFKGFQLNNQLLKSAPENVKIMHCLPAKRGLEITDEVLESGNSIIFEQAENRLHFQRALLKKLIS